MPDTEAVLSGGMTRSILSAVAAVLLVAAVGCGENAPAAIDATVDVAAPVDAPPEIPCSTEVTSTVSIAGQTYGYAAMGNVDAGGESACGGPPEAVMIVLALDAATDDPGRWQYLQLLLPVATGTTSTTIYPATGGAGITVTLDVTSTTAAPTGPGLAQVVGTLSGAATGTFTASACSRLTTSCI